MSDTNHNPSEIDPELLSAFYDGETSIEERAHIEQLMDESQDTLQTLDDYDQLTQSLRELHQATPSPDLREAVLARISTTQTLAEPSAAPPTAGRTRMYSIVASLAVAVMVMILVWPEGPRARLGDVEQSVAMNEAAQNSQELDDAAFAETGRVASAGAALPASGVALAMDADATDTASANMAEMEENIDSALSLAALASKQTVLEPGDVITYLNGNAEEITWVEVTVVDVQSAGDQVQLLLSQHGVQSPDAGDALKQGRQGSEDQFLILVESDWEQLGAVIVELNDRQFVSSMHVNAPLAEAGVPPLLQGFRMERNADSGQAESNKDIGPLRQQAPSLTSRAAGQAAPAGAALGAQTSQMKSEPGLSAIQLPAAVPDAEWQRLAAHRGDQAEGLADAVSEPAAASEPKTADRAAAPTRSAIGRPLARPRVKTVFVIQESND